MQPRFRIEAAGQDATRRILDRLVELRVTLTSDQASDSLDLTLDDRDRALALPGHRSALKLWLGYGEDLRYLGRYLHAELELELAPARMTVRATAADFRRDNALKAPRTRSWDAVTLGALVNQLAAEHGYTGRCSPELAPIVLTHLDQNAESDLHLLRRLSREHGATFKAAGGYLLFLSRGRGVSATGQPLPVLTVRPGDAIRGRVTRRERARYGAVAAKYHDLETGLPVTVQAGHGEPVLELRHIRPDRDRAQADADARLARLSRETATLSLTLPGRPALVAEQRLAMTGWRDGVDGEWAATRVIHTLNPTGFQSLITAEPPP